jgi:hypothetical protein
MNHELIGEYPAADDREQMGRFLRQAFPLGLGSFGELLCALMDNDASGNGQHEAS